MLHWDGGYREASGDWFFDYSDQGAANCASQVLHKKVERLHSLLKL
jgi:hypothetical protein